MSTFAALTVHRSTDRTVEFECGESIADWTFKFDVLSAVGDTTALFELTEGSGVTVTDEDAGELSVSLSASNLNLTPGTYYWGLSRTDVGSKEVVAHGTLTVMPPKAF